MRALIASCLVACSSRGTSAPRAPSSGQLIAEAAAAVRAPGAPPQQWIRFQPQSTYFCVRLADGQLRHAAYGVGGDRYVLQEGLELPHGERDALCTNYGVTVLGARGQLGSVSGYHEHSHTYTPDLIEPEARSLGVVGVSRCFVDAAGTLECGTRYDGKPEPGAALLAAGGPIDHMVPTAPCAVYRDGRVACATENGTPAVVPMFTGAADAAIVSTGWSHYVGCAVLQTGKVACVGSNSLALRSFEDPEASTPVEIPGLAGIEEVTVGGGTACARRGGAVWCWGEAAAMQAGGAAFDASKAMPKCVVDEARTKQAQQEFEAAERACHSGGRPQGDDPMCRGMWRASPPGRQFVPSKTPCDPYEGKAASRWAPPTRVDGIDDALAISSNGGLTCALRPNRVMTCWGNGVRAPQSITFPARTLVAEAEPPAGTPVVVVAAPALAVSATEVVVTSASGSHMRHAVNGAKLGAGAAMPADTTDVLLERNCVLAHGDVTCAPPAHYETPKFPAHEPDAVRISLEMGLGCVLRRDGVLRCGDATTHQYSSQRIATGLAAVAPIVEQGGAYAHYNDGTVREYVSKNQGAPEIVVRWRGVAAMSAAGVYGNDACVVLASGAVECRGSDNRHFQRGDEAQNTDVATPIAGIPRAKAVAVSNTHACVLGEDGTVWCWGRATNGELGADGSKAAVPVGKPEYPDTVPTLRLGRAIQVPGIANAIAIGVGDGLSCALEQDGPGRKLACWGGGSPAVRRVVTTAD